MMPTPAPITVSERQPPGAFAELNGPMIATISYRDHNVAALPSFASLPVRDPLALHPATRRLLLTDARPRFMLPVRPQRFGRLPIKPNCYVGQPQPCQYLEEES